MRNPRIISLGLIIICLILYSCDNSKKTSENQESPAATTTVEKEAKSKPESEEIPSKIQETTLEENEEIKAIFNFGSFEISIDGMTKGSTTPINSENCIDSELEMGEKIESLILNLHPIDTSRSYTLDLKYEYGTNIYLLDDGNENMENWTEELDDNRLDELAKNKYQIKSNQIHVYMEYMRMNFISLRLEALEFSPKDESVQKATKLKELPVEQWTRKATIHISSTNKEGLTEEYYLRLHYPYGC